MGDSHCLQYHNGYQAQNQHSRDKVQGRLGGGKGAQDQDPDCQKTSMYPSTPSQPGLRRVMSTQRLMRPKALVHRTRG